MKEIVTNNIFPFKTNVSKEQREKLLKQRARVIWFTGLSGSGKSTVALALEKELASRNHLCYVLDGDNIRNGLNNNLSFSETDRTENIRRIAEVSKLFLDAGVIVLSCFITPTNELRSIARNIIDQENFIEVYVNCSVEVCEQRDVKGLYAKARKGEIKDFTGVNAAFEEPMNPDLEIRTDITGIEDEVEKILNFILPKISI